MRLSPENCPALVLNADFRPLSYFPLSLWPWQETVKAVFLDRVNILSEYDRVVHSPTFQMRLPSVVSLKHYIAPARRPAFTRFNVFLRDRFQCQYCSDTRELTFDHVVPRSRGGVTCWENVVSGSRTNRAWRRAGRPACPPSMNCAKTAAPSRRAICTKPGVTFFTGIRNSSLKPAR